MTINNLDENTLEPTNFVPATFWSTIRYECENHHHSKRNFKDYYCEKAKPLHNQIIPKKNTTTPSGMAKSD